MESITKPLESMEARLASGEMKVVRLIALQTDGSLLVRPEEGPSMTCLWLETGAPLGSPLEPGDRLVVALVDASLPPVVLGRIGRYPVAGVKLEARECLTLVCGDSSLALRADGKVMIKGEDVLLRAKGTQRIRAGNVAIN